MDENTGMGPLVSEQALKDIERQVKDAVGKGAKILTGGKRSGNKGFFYEPTVITNTASDMEIVKDEVFGPVAAIIKVKNEEEAIAVANSLEFGLGGSVWTRDIEKGKKIAKRIESGAVFVNSVTRSHPCMPFGGIKESGIGRELGRYGMMEFVNIKGFTVFKHG